MNNFINQSISRDLDPLQVKYAYTYARLMRSAKLSIDTPDELLSERLTKVLPEILDECFKAYVASAVKGRAVGFKISGRGIHWDFMNGVTFLTEQSSDPDRVMIKAFEDLPRWTETAYTPYIEVLRSLPNLITRLELIEIEDREMSKLTTEAELRNRIQSNVDLFNDALRNDGFLVHGSGIKITVHHRNSDQVVAGLEAIKSHLLASSDLTEQQMFNKRSVGGGLAGVDQAEREHIASQTIARLTQCWDPVIRLWIHAAGFSAGYLTLNWRLFEQDSQVLASIEKTIAETAEKNISSGILRPEDYRGRYEGGDIPSVLPVVEEVPIV